MLYLYNIIMHAISWDISNVNVKLGVLQVRFSYFFRSWAVLFMFNFKCGVLVLLIVSASNLCIALYAGYVNVSLAKKTHVE